MNKIFSVVLVSLFSSGTAMAGSITNLDPKNQTIVIYEGMQNQQMTLEPQKSIKDICKKQCVIKLSTGTEYEVSANEILSIEGDELFFDDDSNDNQGSGEASGQVDDSGETVKEKDPR